MNFVDTHAHLYASEFESDIAQVIDKAKRNQITKVYLPAIDSESHERLIELYNTDTDFFRPMMGVHPCSINQDYKQELDIAEKWLNTHPFWAAVGEIGLDYHWDVTHKKEQQEAFRIQIEWAIARNLPIVIHSRKSTYECIEILKDYKGKIRGVFHCFSGSKEEANEIIKLGFLLGIGGVVTYKNTGLKELLPAIGLDHLILETDAPYLSPVPYRGKRNESAYIRLIADEIAQILNVGVKEVAEKTTENAEGLFGL
jgi:TatD DNase family protein